MMKHTLILAALMAAGITACGDKPTPPPAPAPKVEAPAPAPAAAPAAAPAPVADGMKPADGMKSADAPKMDAGAAPVAGKDADQKMVTAPPKEGDPKGDPPFGAAKTSSTPLDVAKAAVKGGKEGAKDGGGVAGAAAGAKAGAADAMKK